MDEAKSMDVDTARAARRRVMKILVVLLAVAGLGWGLVLAGDWVYARAVAHRYREWERTVERDADGVRAGCRAFATGEGPVALLMVHGYGDSPAMYRKMAGALAGRGYACRAMRLPGFAEPIEAYRQTSLAKWKAAVREEARQLAGNHDAVWLVGHSTGAALAIREVLAEGSPARGLVLLAPLLEVSSERSPVLETRQWFEFGRRTLHHTRVLETAFPVNAHDPEAQAYPYRDRFVPIEVTENLYALLDEVRGQAGRVEVPVLMALAANDQVVDNAAARAFFDGLPGPRNRLVEQPLAGHMIALDTGWSNLVAEIDAFVRDGGGTGP